MKTMITPAEVIDTAFQETDQLDQSVINEIKIEAAQIQFIRPALGEGFYDRLIDGEFEPFLKDYVKPPLAFYVRYITLLNLSVRTGNLGITRHSAGGSESASPAEIHLLKRETLRIADSLLNKATGYLRSHPEQFPPEITDNLPRRTTRNIGGIIL